MFTPDAPDLLDVNVFHPLYVDEAGHEYGGASPEYAVMVARADAEIATLLARMDLSKDLVILTADHGHRDQGGHGGAEPVIREVLVCFAGPSVVRRSDRAPFDGRSTAPTVATLLGVPYPRQMRAVEDGLDVIWDVVDEKAVGARYVEDRRAAVERFRAANRAALEAWLAGPPGSWTRLYEREAGAQVTRGIVRAFGGWRRTNAGLNRLPCTARADRRQDDAQHRRQPFTASARIPERVRHARQSTLDSS